MVHSSVSFVWLVVHGGGGAAIGCHFGVVLFLHGAAAVCCRCGGLVFLGALFVDLSCC